MISSLLYSFCKYKSPRLNDSNFFAANNKLSRGSPKKPRSSEQKCCKQRDQRISNLEPIAKEPRPELGSLFSGIFSLWIAFWIADVGANYLEVGAQTARILFYCSGCWSGPAGYFWASDRMGYVESVADPELEPSGSRERI